MNFLLRMQVNTWEIYMWFPQDLELTGNLNSPHSDKAGPTCSSWHLHLGVEALRRTKKNAFSSKPENDQCPVLLSNFQETGLKWTPAWIHPLCSDVYKRILCVVQVSLSMMYWHAQISALPIPFILTKHFSSATLGVKNTLTSAQEDCTENFIWWLVPRKQCCGVQLWF